MVSLLWGLQNQVECRNLPSCRAYYPYPLYFMVSYKLFSAIYLIWLIIVVQFSSVQSISHVQLFATPWTTAHQAFLSITNSRSLPKLISIESVMPSNHLILSPSPAFSLFQHQSLFIWVSSLHQVTKVLEFQLQHQSFQWTLRTDVLYDWLVGSSCSPRDSQESSPTPQFKSIKSSVLSFLYSPTLTSIHAYWKNYSLD